MTTTSAGVSTLMISCSQTTTVCYKTSTRLCQTLWTTITASAKKTISDSTSILLDQTAREAPVMMASVIYSTVHPGMNGRLSTVDADQPSTALFCAKEACSLTP